MDYCIVVVKKVSSYAMHYILAGTLLSAVLWCPMRADMYYEEGRNIDALFEKVPYLDLSEKTRSIIELEYKKGIFNTIERGFHRIIYKKDDWKAPFYIHLILASIVAWGCLDYAETNHGLVRQVLMEDVELLLIFLTLFLVGSVFLFLHTYDFYARARDKGCWLITDTGCLAIDNEGVVFLQYKNLLDVAFIKKRNLPNLYNEKFARIMSQREECFDFQPSEFVSFEAFDALFQEIKTKIEKERERQAKMKKANQSDLPQQDWDRPVRRYV